MAANYRYSPDYWSPMSPNEPLAVLDLPQTYREYLGIRDAFLSTTVSQVQVQWIHRVQNIPLWSQYMHKHSRMAINNGGIVNERLLFHGSPNFQSICSSEDGFDMRLAKNGVWGRGNYFAEKAEYSHTYAFYDGTSACHVVILAKVLTGISYPSTGDSSLTRPPNLPGDPGRRYDTVNGGMSTSRIFVTYSNDLSYPAYLICYRRTNLGVQGGAVYVNPLLTATATEANEDILFNTGSPPPVKLVQPVATSNDERQPMLPRQPTSTCHKLCGRCFICFYSLLCVCLVFVILFIVGSVLVAVKIIKL